MVLVIESFMVTKVKKYIIKYYSIVSERQNGEYTRL